LGAEATAVPSTETMLLFSNGVGVEPLKSIPAFEPKYHMLA
jgi:hypothetical protein